MSSAKRNHINRVDWRGGILWYMDFSWNSDSTK